MKKILLLIFICVILIFMGCAEKSDMTATDTSIDETKLTEQSATGKAEMSDEEYLINLGKRLRMGMTEEEVIAEIGEPDEAFGSGIYRLIYRIGDCHLFVFISNRGVDCISVYGEDENRVYHVYLKEDDTGEGDTYAVKQ